MIGNPFVPPIRSDADGPTVRVPPAALRPAVKVERNSVLLATLRSPAMVALPASVFVPVPLTFSVPYVCDATVWLLP